MNGDDIFTCGNLVINNRKTQPVVKYTKVFREECICFWLRSMVLIVGIAAVIAFIIR